MKRKSIPQISNAAWFPSFLRNCIHEFMTWFVVQVGAAKPFLPVVERGLKHAAAIVVIEKRVGAGFETLDPLIDPTIRRFRVSMDDFKATSKGLYISVNAFHQMEPQAARKLLERVAEQHQPIVIVEGNNDSLWQVFGMLVIVPLTILLTAPLVKPFRIERLLFTYLIPILPIVTFVDGFIALFKLYAPGDLAELTNSIQQENYCWESGKLDNGRGGKIIYLFGYPANGSDKS